MVKASIIKAWFCKNQSALMLATGITGMVTTTVLAVRGHSKAKEIMFPTYDDAEAGRTYCDKKGICHIKKRYWVKKTWKCYAPAAITGSLSVACLCGSYRVNQRRNAALASSLALSEAAMTEYQKAVVDTIGEEAEKGIREKFHATQVAKTQPALSQENHEYLEGDRSVNCYEATTQQKFWASKEDIRRAVNDLNQERLMGFDDEVTLNDFYNAIGCKTTTAGDVLGWNIDNPVNVDISAIEVDGIPCLYIQPVNWVSLI